MTTGDRAAVAFVVVLYFMAKGKEAEAERRTARAPRALPRTRSSNPFPPQPEPTLEELLLEPTDPRYPMYADLLWIHYAEHAKHGGPLPSSMDLSEARDATPRTLTAFERWALQPFVPVGFTLPAAVTSVTSRPRFERWSLAKAAYDFAREKRVAEPMARELRTQVARKLYERARDYYRSSP